MSDFFSGNPEFFLSDPFYALAYFALGFLGWWLSFRASKSYVLSLFFSHLPPAYTRPVFSGIMECGMLSARHKNKVLYSIVKYVAVYMVDDLISFEPSAYVYLHNKAVLEYLPTSVLYHPVARFTYPPGFSGPSPT